jgi:hypothetical protein
MLFRLLRVEILGLPPFPQKKTERMGHRALIEIPAHGAFRRVLNRRFLNGWLRRVGFWSGGAGAGPRQMLEFHCGGACKA